MGKRPRTKVRRPKKVRASGRRRTSNGVRQHTLKNVVVQGTRALLSVLPGTEFLLPVADILFTALGFTSNMPTITKGVSTKVNAGLTGLSSFTGISLSNIVARSPIVARADKHINTRGYEFYLPFTDAKLITLTIVAQVANIQSNRSGRWGIAFVPIRDAHDLTELPSKYEGISLSGLASIPGAVISNVDRPLTLHYRPSVKDGQAYRFQRISDCYGFLITSYADEMRVTYNDFSASDYSPNIVMSGKVALSQPVGDAKLETFYDTTWKFDPQPGISLTNLYQGVEAQKAVPDPYKIIGTTYTQSASGSGLDIELQPYKFKSFSAHTKKVTGIVDDLDLSTDLDEMVLTP